MSEPNGAQSNKILFALIMLISLPVYTTDVTLSILAATTKGIGGHASQAQLIIMMFLASYAILQVPTGLLADRYGRRPVLFSGLFVFFIGGIITSLSQTMDTLLFGRLIQGCGGAVAAMLSRTICRDISSGRTFARMMATMIASLAFVSMISPLIGGLLESIFNWRAVYISILIYSICLIILLILWLPETNPGKHSDRGIGEQLKLSFVSLLQTPMAIWSTLLLAVFFFGFVSLISTFSLIAEDVYGISTMWTSIIIASGLFMYFLSSMISRHFAHSLGPKWMMFLSACFFTIASACLFLAFYRSPLSIAFLCLAIIPFLIAFGLFFSNATAMYLEKLPNTAGFVSGIVGSFQIGAGSMGALLSSRIYDGTPYPMVGILLTCSALMVLIYILGFIVIPEARPAALRGQQ